MPNKSMGGDTSTPRGQKLPLAKWPPEHCTARQPTGSGKIRATKWCTD